MQTTERNIKNVVKHANYLDGKGGGHNGHHKRNLMVTYINMPPGVNVGKYMHAKKRFARSNHKIEAITIMNSWSLSELDPTKEEDVLLANEIMKKFVLKYYKNRACAIYLQADGKGGREKKPKLHCHTLISDFDEENKATTNEQRHVPHIRRRLNKIASQYHILDTGKKSAAKITQAERGLEEKAELIRQQYEGLSQDEIREKLIENDCYSMKREMQEIIQEAAQICNNEEDFSQELERHGIRIKRKHSKKKNEDYYNYTYESCPISTVRKTVSSYKFGYEFCPDALEKKWQEKDQVHIESKESDFLKSMAEIDESNSVSDTESDIGDDHPMMEELPIVTQDVPAEAEEMPQHNRNMLQRLLKSNIVKNNEEQIAAEILLRESRAAAANAELQLDEKDGEQDELTK